MSPVMVLMGQPLMPPCALISSIATCSPRLPATSKKEAKPLSPDDSWADAYYRKGNLKMLSRLRFSGR